jgi:hypothetical protein
MIAQNRFAKIIYVIFGILVATGIYFIIQAAVSIALR